MIFKFLLAATLLRIVPLFNPKRVLTLPKDFLLKVLKVSMAIISHMSYFASGSFRNWIVETSSCSFGDHTTKNLLFAVLLPEPEATKWKIEPVFHQGEDTDT